MTQLGERYGFLLNTLTGVHEKVVAESDGMRQVRSEKEGREGVLSGKEERERKGEY